MRIRSFLLLSLLLSNVAQAATMSLQVTARSLDLRSASYTETTPAGPAIIHFTTYSPTREPLYLYQPEVAYVSGELRPRSLATGVYETDYHAVQGNTVIEYGALVLTLPTTDANGNGLADFMELNQPASATVTGTVTVDQPATASGTVMGTLTRAAG
ncbi:MAG TPA: hypothetical protein VHF69_05875, partial [Candidatus Synoicihabitans sp.]|nr:hypothetical protein [Candidatus Synoicihabitans sp.]